MPRASPRGRRAGGGGNDAVDLGGHGRSEGGVPADQPGEAVGPVFGLHDQIDRGEARRASGPATTTISEGPAKAEATPTTPDTWRLASAT